MEEGDKDPWLAIDKLYHILMCFFLTLLFYPLAAFTPLRRRPISVASLLSLLAGAAKEGGDELGYFRSSGASLKDGVADILGVLMGSFALFLFRSLLRSPPPPPPPQPHLPL